MSAIVSYPFDNPANFDFNADEVSVSAGLGNLSDRRPADSVLYSSFLNTINTSWLNIDGATIIGTSIGGAVIVSGFLDLKGGTVKYIDYDISSLDVGVQKGTREIFYKPDYSGTPSGLRAIWIECRADNDRRNHVAVFHKDNGQLAVQIRDKDDVVIVNTELGLWVPVAGQVYIFSWNFDCDAGVHRLFIDGTQFGVTLSGTGIRDNNIDLLRVGSTYTSAASADHEIKNCIIYSEVQHTINYTPDFSNIYETIYLTSNPFLKLSQILRIEELLGFLAAIIKSGLDDIKFSLEKDDTPYYFNGSDWVVSNGDYAQTNTVAEIVANKSTFTTEQIDFNVRVYFHSEAGLTTPNIDLLTITYDFSGEKQDDINKCAVYWYSRKSDGSVCTDEIIIIPKVFNIKYKNNIFICQKKITVTPNPNTGYVEANLIENVNMEDIDGNPVTYLVKKGQNQIGEISVPNQPGALLWDVLV